MLNRQKLNLNGNICMEKVIEKIKWYKKSLFKWTTVKPSLISQK